MFKKNIKHYASTTKDNVFLTEIFSHNHHLIYPIKMHRVLKMSYKQYRSRCDSVFDSSCIRVYIK